VRPEFLAEQDPAGWLARVGGEEVDFDLHFDAAGVGAVVGVDEVAGRAGLAEEDEALDVIFWVWGLEEAGLLVIGVDVGVEAGEEGGG